jgi:hypothetical protein
MTRIVEVGKLGQAVNAQANCVDRGSLVAVSLSGRDKKGRVVPVTRFLVPLRNYSSSPQRALIRPSGRYRKEQDRNWRRFVRRAARDAGLRTDGNGLVR